MKWGFYLLKLRPGGGFKVSCEQRRNCVVSLRDFTHAESSRLSYCRGHYLPRVALAGCQEACLPSFRDQVPVVVNAERTPCSLSPNTIRTATATQHTAGTPQREAHYLKAFSSNCEAS